MVRTVTLTMPKSKKGKPGIKRALDFAVKHKFRAFPVFHVGQVTSGDVVDLTLDLGFTLFKQERVALSGIVAPSIRTKGVEEKALAEKAKTELGRLLNAADQLECVVDGKDKNGRTTGVLFGKVGESLNDQLMNGGFVWSIVDETKDLGMLRILQGSDF